MDIQISSNFERLLYDVMGRDAGALRNMMATLQQSKSFTIPSSALDLMRRDFTALRADRAAVDHEMKQTWQRAGYLLDPHTAIGVKAARALLKEDHATPVVALGTAHPAKFPDAVKAATGVHPALPEHLADLMSRKERVTELPNDQAKIEAFITAHARAAQE
jgi:threonine synthase